jgi:hypothetical protein
VQIGGNSWRFAWPFVTTALPRFLSSARNARSRDPRDQHFLSRRQPITNQERSGKGSLMTRNNDLPEVIKNIPGLFEVEWPFLHLHTDARWKVSHFPADAIVRVEGRDGEARAIFALSDYVEASGRRDHSDLVLGRDYGQQYTRQAWHDEL